MLLYNSYKRLLLILLFAWMIVTNVMGEKLVHIYAKDGEVISLSLKDNLIVSFESDNIVIDLVNKKLIFSLDDYVKFDFGEQPNNIDSLCKNSKDIHIDIEGSILTINHLVSRSPVRFYSISGVLLNFIYADENGSLHYDLGKLNKQVILVNTVSKSFKICL